MILHKSTSWTVRKQHWDPGPISWCEGVAKPPISVACASSGTQHPEVQTCFWFDLLSSIFTFCVELPRNSSASKDRFQRRQPRWQLAFPHWCSRILCKSLVNSSIRTLIWSPLKVIHGKSLLPERPQTIKASVNFFDKRNLQALEVFAVRTTSKPSAPTGYRRVATVITSIFWNSQPWPWFILLCFRVCLSSLNHSITCHWKLHNGSCNGGQISLTHHLFLQTVQTWFLIKRFT